MPDDGGDSEGYASVDSSLGLPSYDLHSVHSDPVRRNLKPHRQHFASFKLTERLTVPGGVRKSERLFHTLERGLYSDIVFLLRNQHI